MKNNFTLLLVLMCTGLFAQNHPSCDGLRYRTDVFEEVESTLGLKYGEGTTINGEFQELFLDVYEPVGDEAATRPVVILAFGGSFIFGERADLQWLCEAYARKGFVAVSIDYRLYDGPLFPLPSGEQMKDVVIRAVSDMKAAVRFFREDADTANDFKIDTDRIFVGGISAGAIVASHVAMLDESDDIPADLLAIMDMHGGIDGNSSTNVEYSSDVQGLINYSGGLNDASWIDVADPPFVSVHDDMDGVVPYGPGFASILTIEIVYLEGSQVMNHLADSLGMNNELMTIENSNGHVSYFGEDEPTNGVLDFSAQFVHDIICPEEISNVVDFATAFPSVVFYPNPTKGQLSISNAAEFNLEARLYSPLGQQLGQWTNVNSIDLSNLNAGAYFLELENVESGTRAGQLIVVE